jgi:hypothetical protein
VGPSIGALMRLEEPEENHAPYLCKYLREHTYLPTSTCRQVLVGKHLPQVLGKGDPARLSKPSWRGGGGVRAAPKPDYRWMGFGVPGIMLWHRRACMACRWYQMLATPKPNVCPMCGSAVRCAPHRSRCVPHRLARGPRIGAQGGG